MDPARRTRIFGLALPIIGGMVSQNLLNIVDTAMVGFLGDAALAAVGLGGFVVFMCQAMIMGISTGVQSTAARRKGEGRADRAAAILNAALGIVLVVAVLTGTPAYAAETALEFRQSRNSSGAEDPQGWTVVADAGRYVGVRIRHDDVLELALRDPEGHVVRRWLSEAWPPCNPTARARFAWVARTPGPWRVDVTAGGGAPVDYEIVWDVVTNKLPHLGRQIEVVEGIGSRR